MERSQKRDGPVYFHSRTKVLTQWIPSGAFALLEHRDIDETAALDLIDKKVRAVLNYEHSMSGEYASRGTLHLVKHGIPVYDIDEPEKVRGQLKQGEMIRIAGERLWRLTPDGPHPLSTLSPYTERKLRLKHQAAQLNFNRQYTSFVYNTLYHVHREMGQLLQPLTIPRLSSVNLLGQAVVIVTRGPCYRHDLEVIMPYITATQPILIGVDGGADALLERGLTPHLILGDMDSVSKRALHSGAELIVHAYRDGRAPGLDVVFKEGLCAHTFRCFGTSEDAAHLLADEAGAAVIISIGSHTYMEDFLEKGRQGMASSFLVRLKLGGKLIDARGVHQLFSLEGEWRRDVQRQYHHSGL